MSRKSKKTSAQEFRQYKALAEFLEHVNHEKQHIRMFCTGGTGQIPITNPSPTKTTRSTVVSVPRTRRVSLRRIRATSVRLPTFSSPGAKDIKAKLSHIDDPEPTLHVFSVNLGWLRRAVTKRSMTAEASESLQNLLQWLYVKPDTDLLGAEKLGDELDKFPTQNSAEEAQLELIKSTLTVIILELRARAAEKIYSNVLTALTNRTLPVCWEVLCEEHEAAAISRAASQIKRPNPGDIKPTDDTVCQVVEGINALVDANRREDQLKRVIDGIDWFSRNVKILGGSLVGVSACIYDHRIRSGLEIDLQKSIDTIGGVRAFNELLASKGLSPIPINEELVRAVRQRRRFLIKTRNGLVNLLVECMAVLGNFSPLDTLDSRSPNFYASAEASLQDHSDDDTETDADLEGFDPSDLPARFFPTWWSEFNSSMLYRKNLYLSYTNSVGRANATRVAEQGRMMEQGHGVEVPMIRVLDEEEWYDSTMERIKTQANNRARKEHVARVRAMRLGGKVPVVDNSSLSLALAGGSLDNLRPASMTIPNRATMLMNAGLTSSTVDPGNSLVEVPHLIESYLDRDRQGKLPTLELSGHGTLLTMTRQELGTYFQRCVRLRDICSAAVEACSQTISKLTTIDRVLSK